MSFEEDVLSLMDKYITESEKVCRQGVYIKKDVKNS